MSHSRRNVFRRYIRTSAFPSRAINTENCRGLPKGVWWEKLWVEFIFVVFRLDGARLFDHLTFENVCVFNMRYGIA